MATPPRRKKIRKKTHVPSSKPPKSKEQPESLALEPLNLDEEAGQIETPSATESKSTTTDINDDDDLTLQLEEEPESEPQSTRRQPPRKMPTDLHGKPSETGDPMRVLIAGGLVAAVIVIGFTYYLFKTPSFPPRARSSKSSRSSKPPTPKRTASSKKPTPNKSIDKSKKQDTPSASSPPPPLPAPKSPLNVKQQHERSKIERYQSNAANQRSFHSIYAFMQWAMKEGRSLNGKLLSTRFKGKVSINGADDPDVLEVYRKFLELCRVAKKYPLNPRSGEILSSAHGDKLLSKDESRKKHLLRIMRIRNKNRILEQRYGKP